MLLNRGNIPDTLMVLLLLLAADATVSAIVSGRLRSLVLAGILVGLAFQAKMIEAWLILPALALAYLVSARGRLGRKLAQLLAAGAVVAAVSLSWMALVSVWPAHDRPYVDGSTTNSIFSQVFVYNGFGRLDQASPNQLLTKSIGLPLGSTPPGWDRLFSGADGRDTAWLIPAALVALVACVLACRRRHDLLRAGTALWGTWLVVLLIVFSASTTINPYYTAALSPAIAALVGMGLALAWEHRTSPVARRAVGATVAVTCGYAIWLLPSRGVGLVSGLPEAVGVLGFAAVAILVLPARVIPARLLTGAGAVALAAIAVVAVPAAASVSVVAKRFGPVRHAVRRSGRIGPGPDPRWCGHADRSATPGTRGRRPEPAGPDGDSDLRRRCPIHLRQRQRGPTDRRVHRDDPGAVGGHAAIDDPRGRLPHRDPIADGHRSSPRGGGPAVLPLEGDRPGPRPAAVRGLLLRAATRPLSNVSTSCRRGGS